MGTFYGRARILARSKLAETRTTQMNRIGTCKARLWELTVLRYHKPSVCAEGWASRITPHNATYRS